jgi:hypothetical protein
VRKEIKRILIAVLYSLIPIIGLFIYQAIGHREIIYKNTKDDAQLLNRVLSENFKDEIKKTEILLKTLSFLNQKDTAKEVINNYLEFDPLYSAAGITNKEGIIILSRPESLNKIDVSDRKYFTDAKETLSFSTGEYQIGRIINKQVIVFSYPILDEKGEFNGVAFAGIDLVSLNNQASEKINIPQGGSITLLDKNGTVIARNPDGEKYIGKKITEESAVAKKAISEKNMAAVDDIDLDGVYKMFAYAPLDSSGNLFLMSGIPMEIPKSQIRQLTISTIILSLIALSFSIFTALIVGAILSKKSNT